MLMCVFNFVSFILKNSFPFISYFIFIFMFILILILYLCFRMRLEDVPQSLGRQADCLSQEVHLQLRVGRRAVCLGKVQRNSSTLQDQEASYHDGITHRGRWGAHDDRRHHEGPIDDLGCSAIRAEPNQNQADPTNHALPCAPLLLCAAILYAKNSA